MAVEVTEKQKEAIAEALKPWTTREVITRWDRYGKTVVIDDLGTENAVEAVVTALEGQ